MNIKEVQSCPCRDSKGLKISCTHVYYDLVSDMDKVLLKNVADKSRAEGWGSRGISNIFSWCLLLWECVS